MLLRLHEPDSGRSKLLVWGDKRTTYHMDIYSRVKALVRLNGPRLAFHVIAH